jgi:23S rRNA pseudouridine955/2504/2580 synthase
MSLARYLSRAFPLLPGHVLRNALKRRDVRVNGERNGDGVVVNGGDQLSVYIDERFLTAPTKVLYEDHRVLALEKPQGLPVDVDEDGIGEDTLLRRAQAIHPEAMLCHRLDAGTGGVVLMALTGDAYSEITGYFKDHLIGKTYRCLVAGRPESPEGTLVHYLLKDADTARVRETDRNRPGALRAELSYRVVEAYGDTTLVEIDLGTGRTHQIRAQMALIGCPVVGDDKYGDRAVNKRLHAVFTALWCVRLRLPDGRAFESSADF